MKKSEAQKSSEQRKLIKTLRDANKQLAADMAATLKRHAEERKDRENTIVKYMQQAREARTHCNRIEEQLKTWTHALNRLFGIAVRFESPWIEFVCDYQTVRIHESNALKPLIDQIITLFLPLSKEAVKSAIPPQNKFDGVDGWVHPDVVEGEQDRKREEIIVLMENRGMKREAAFLDMYWKGQHAPIWTPNDENCYPKKADSDGK